MSDLSEQSPCSDGEVCSLLLPIFVWKHVIKEDNQVKCRYCNQVWDRAALGHSTSPIRAHMFKCHLQEVYPIH